MANLDDQFLNFPCPKCKEEVAVKIGDFKASDYSPVCDSCGAIFTIPATDLKAQLKKVMQEQLKGFGANRKNILNTNFKF